MTGPRELPTELLAAAEMSKKTHRSIFKPKKSQEASGNRVERATPSTSGQALRAIMHFLEPSTSRDTGLQLLTGEIQVWLLL